MLFMKMVSAAPASRSEEEDRELVPRRRGPAALDRAQAQTRKAAQETIAAALSTRVPKH